MTDKYSVLNDAKYFGENESQNCLVFQPIPKYLSYSIKTSKISSWTSIGMSEESTKNSSIADNSFGPEKIGQYTNLTVKFNENCLRQDRISFIH